MEIMNWKDEEVNEENLEEYLLEDVLFIQFFNSFLSLPVFPQRLVYNIVNGCFEQFHNFLADDVSGDGNIKEAANLKARFAFFKSTIDEKRRRIGYYVKFHDKEEGLHWVKKYRLPLFLKSEIYADFKLSRLISNAQIEFLKKLLEDGVSNTDSVSESNSPPVETSTPQPVDTIEACSEQTEDDNIECSKHFERRSSSDYSSSAESEHEENSNGIPLWMKEQIKKREMVFDDQRSKNKETKVIHPSEDANDNYSVSQSIAFQLYRVPEDDEDFISEDNLSQHKLDESIDLPYSQSRTSFVQDEFSHENTLTAPQQKLTAETLKVYSEMISRRHSIDVVKETMNNSNEDFQSFGCDDNAISKVLSVFDNQKESENECLVMNDFVQDSSLCPINLSYKEAVDAFKEFLVDTPGEKNLLLWLEVERAKYYNQLERQRTLITIKERFIRAGSPYKIPTVFLKSWGIADVSSLSMERLIFVRRKIIDPLLKYWVQRFTLHRYREKQRLLSQTYTDLYDPRLKSIVGKNLPQRPKSCMNHVRIEQQNELFKDSVSDTDSGICMSEELFTGRESGLTRKKLRAKTAYPRLISTKTVQHTNVGAEQLELVSNNTDEGFGFQPFNFKFFPNDASDADHKNSVRLYIQPVPGVDAVASTLSSSPVFRSQVKSEFEEEEDNIDGLVDCLLHERHSGSYFQQYLYGENNKLWLNCYHFWLSLQEYNEYFFADTFVPLAVKRKANKIYMTYITSGSENDIDCLDVVQAKIYKQLDPPYEDLFDEVEQHILGILVKPWLTMKEEERKQYEELKMEQQLKFIEVNRKQKYNLQNELEELAMDSLEDDNGLDEDKISPEEILQPLPLSKDGFNFQELLRNKSELEFFQTFLETRHKQGITDLTAWTEIEVFLRLPRAQTTEEKELRDIKAKELCRKWLNKDYFFGGTTPASKAARQKFLEKFGKKNVIPERPPSPALLEAQKYSRARVERRWLLLFKQTKEYVDRRKKRSGVAELVEDLLMKKKLQRSEQAWRMLNSRWNAGSREIIALRLALSDLQESEYLRRFVSIHGEMMDQNFNFWLEVQKYKDLCHNHVGESTIRNKIQAILDVFIKSTIPPELQIDIPIEMAERLYEKVTLKTVSLGPYLFREAQATVFRIIFNFWKDFLMFRDQLGAEESMSEALGKLENTYQLEIRQKKMFHERKRLGKLVNEKRRRDHMTKERERSKGNDLFSFVSKTIDSSSDIIEGDITTFQYSKHTAEQDLKELEEKMKEQGCLGCNEDSTTMRSMSHHHSIGGDTSSVISKTTKLTTNRTAGARMIGQRRMSFFNTTGAVERMKISFGESFDKNEEMRSREKRDALLDNFDARSRFTRRSRGPSVSFKVDDQKTRYSRRRTAVLHKDIMELKNTSDTRSSQFGLDKVSCVTDLKKLKRREIVQGDNDESNSKNNGKTLTKKSLREFERSPQGKQLKVPLPILRIKQRSLNGESLTTAPSDLPKIDIKQDSQIETKKVRKTQVLRQYRLPKNAGTVAILKKLDCERPRIESPPPEILAEVFVC